MKNTFILAILLVGITIYSTVLNSRSITLGFNPLWLLPLLIIPAIFMALQSGSYDNEEYYNQQALTGVKGGRSRLTKDEVEQEVL